MLVRVYHNGDDVFVAWKPDGFIPNCRGFALLRRRSGIEEVVSTWVGFEDDTTTDGKRRASTNWPIQKYQWTDYMANPGNTLAYRVLPMIGPDKQNLRPDPATASDWTPEVTLSHEESPHLEGLFNRELWPRNGCPDASACPVTSYRTRSWSRSSQLSVTRSASTWPGRWGRGCSACSPTREPAAPPLRGTLRTRRPAVIAALTRSGSARTCCWPTAA